MIPERQIESVYPLAEFVGHIFGMAAELFSSPAAAYDTARIGREALLARPLTGAEQLHLSAVVMREWSIRKSAHADSRLAVDH